MGLSAEVICLEKSKLPCQASIQPSVQVYQPTGLFVRPAMQNTHDLVPPSLLPCTHSAHYGVTKPLVGLQSSFCMGSEMDSVLTGSQGRHIPHHLLFMKVKKVN
jgi:hypothetical protein